MSLQVENLEHNMAKVTIEVEAAKLDDAIKQAFNKKKGQFNVPGFRKGKVPFQLIAKEYGVEIFYEDAANILIPDAYAEAMKDTDLEIVSRPEIDVTQLEKGKDFIFTATFALKPEVTLGDYKGIEVPKTRVTVKKDEIEEELKKVQEQNAREITVDRPAENGDTVVIDFEGSVDGEVFEGGTAENHPLVLGSGSFIPGFEDQLVGATADSDVEVNVTFPEDYQAKDLAGKAAVFKVKVHEIKKKELPEINDEFAQDVSEFDTLDEYKEDVKKGIAEQKEKAVRQEKQEKIIRQIVENAEMDIPDAMLNTQVRQMLDDFSRRMQSQGLTMEQYFQFTGMTLEKMQEEMKPQALKRIQSRLVLEAVAAAEKIEASEEDFENEVQKMAESYKMEADKVKEIMGEAGKKQIMEDLAVSKAADFVRENAKEKKAKAKKAKTEE